MRTSILMLNERFGERGEAEQYLLHFSECFTDLGYQITLAYGRKSPAEFSSPVIHEVCLPFLGEWWRPATAFELRALTEAAQAARPKLLILHNLVDWRVLDALASALPGVPRVWFAHTQALQWLEGVMAPQPPRGALTRWLFGQPTQAAPSEPPPRRVNGPRDGAPDPLQERRRFLRSLQQCDQVVTANAETAARLLRHLPAPFPPLAVVPYHSRPAALGREATRVPLVLCTGPIARRRGVAELINAMALVQGVAERLLRIVGPVTEPEYLDWCRTLAQTLMEEETALRIEFELEADAEALERAYAEATVVAVPTLWPEAFQIDVLEAMERGLPVVGCDVGHMDVVLRDGVTGLLVPPGNVGALAAGLERLLVNRDEARRMGGAARLLAEWEFHARDHVAALDRIFELLLYPEPQARLSDEALSS